jgi:hypothetical protein
MSKRVEKDTPPIIERYWVVFNTYTGGAESFHSYDAALRAAATLANSPSCLPGYHVSVCPALKTFSPTVRVLASATTYKF